MPIRCSSSPPGLLGRATLAVAAAKQALPIPNVAALDGAVLFGQWVHALAGGVSFASTEAIVLHVFP